MQPLRVGLDLARFAVDEQRDLLGHGQESQRAGRLLDDLPEVELDREQLELPFLDRRQRQKVVDRTTHPVDLLTGALEHLAGRG